MRILQLCHKPPFPANDGGTRAMHANTLAFAELGHTVDVVTLETPKHPMRWDELTDEYLELTKPEVHFHNSTPTKLGAITSMVFGENFHLKRFDVPEVHALISKKLSEYDYDVVWFESVYTACYLKTVRANAPNAKCILRAHNIEHKLWEGRLSEYPTYMQPIIKSFNMRLEVSEKEAFEQMDVIAPISRQDAEYINALFPSKADGVLSYFPWDQPDLSFNEKPLTVRYIGALDWEPNIQGVLWLVNEVWPLVRRDLPDATLEIAGRNTVDRLFELQSESVRILGEVENANVFMQEATVLAVPLFSGGGIRIKLIEAAALKKAVVATSKAIDGLSFSAESIRIADSPVAYASALVELLTDEGLRMRFKNEIYAAFETNYGKEAYLKIVKHLLIQEK